MNLEQVKEWLLAFNQAVQEEKAYLTELDTPIGDADHGSNMARGSQAMVDAIQAQDPQAVDELLKLAAMQLISQVGGAAGPLYGSAFMGLSQVASQDELPLAEGIQAGLDMIQQRGKAEPGEKTMVDVWAPCAQALADGQVPSAQDIDGWVQVTKDMRASKGRASYVGERSIGHIDPGSYSSGLLFKALIEQVGD